MVVACGGVAVGAAGFIREPSEMRRDGLVESRGVYNAVGNVVRQCLVLLLWGLRVHWGSQLKLCVCSIEMRADKGRC